jgi:hypothetical protein
VVVQKRNAFKVVDKEGMVSSAIKKKASTLYLNNKKDALKAFQELSRHHPLQDHACKDFNSFERQF